MKEFTDEMDREVTFKNRLESFKKNVKDYFEYDYKNKNGGEDPWEICLIRDGYRIASQAEELINRQKAEIESLKQIIERLGRSNTSLLKKKCKASRTATKIIKSEAIKEFAIKLRCGVPYETGVIRCKDVDELVKEMTEEK